MDLSLGLREIMKCNKLKTLLVLVILIFSIGMVSAAESVPTDLDVNDGNDLIKQANDVEIVSDGAVGTFTDLNNDLKNAKEGKITLTKDYKFDASTDNSLKTGIEIDNIVINGNNHTIDGSNLARIFTQYSGSVTLNDIKFVNGYVGDKANGAAYLLTTGTLTVNNCLFENNSAGRHGGAIGVTSIYQSNPVSVKNSVFRNNSAKFNGGSVYARELLVEDSLFENNKILTRSSSEWTLIEQKGLGGAVFSHDGRIKNSLFKSNRVLNSGYYQIEEGGGAITSIGSLIVDNSTFIDNTALKGGAIFGIAQFDSDLVAKNNVTVINSMFMENVAQSGGAICSNFNVTVDNSLFDNNTANGYGGGAISTGFKSNENLFKNSNFTNNLAFNYGGAISSSHSKVENCLFENNEANHGGAIFSLSFEVEDSTFKDNVGVYGNETIVVVDALKKDSKTKLSDDEVKVFDQNKVTDYSVDVLDGNPANTKYITSGKYEGYEVFCIEQHLFYPDNTEGVMVDDLTYIVNSLDRTVVGDYIRILFYLRDAYPERYTSYSLSDIQDIVWMFTDGHYKTSRDRLVRDVIAAYESGEIVFNDNNTYYLPDGTLMEYNMEIFLTPADRQNMVLFKSQPFVPTYNETVIKDTINRTVLVGENVQFKITVVNTGNMVLPDVFVSDTQYSKGLTYVKWYNDKGDWTYKGNGLWVLNYDLEPKENASFIIEFSTSVLGNLTNNVTSGYMNITLSNSTNKTTTLPNPKMAVRKITNNYNVVVGEEVSFDVVVENVGEYEITGLYIVDTYYSKGLKYDYFVDRTDSWVYRGNGIWDYKYPLPVGEKAKITLFFLTTKTGIQFNWIYAGNNQTPEIERSRNTTNVTKNNNTPEEEDDKNKSHNNTTVVKKHHKIKHIYDKNATGNPLFALILVLLSLGAMTLKRK